MSGFYESFLVMSEFGPGSVRNPFQNLFQGILKSQGPQIFPTIPISHSVNY